jgi:hypothetical protein
MKLKMNFMGINFEDYVDDGNFSIKSCDRAKNLPTVKIMKNK